MNTIQLHDFIRDTRITISPLARGMWHRVHAYNEVTGAEREVHTLDMDGADVLADLLLELVGSKRK